MASVTPKGDIQRKVMSELFHNKLRKSWGSHLQVTPKLNHKGTSQAAAKSTPISRLLYLLFPLPGTSPQIFIHMSHFLLHSDLWSNITSSERPFWPPYLKCHLMALSSLILFYCSSYLLSLSDIFIIYLFLLGDPWLEILTHGASDLSCSPSNVIIRTPVLCR